MYYFAYGSNMSVKRLQQRVPSARRLGVAVLARHRLKMHKVGRLDGTAKCDILPSDNPAQCVYGVVYRIAENEKQLLDAIEGLGQGYDEKQVSVELMTNNDEKQPVSAFTYYATDINPDLLPLDWYLQHVLTGAQENSLPASYIEEIAAIKTPGRMSCRSILNVLAKPRHERACLNMSIVYLHFYL